jgi:hypothetical protein
MTQTTIDTTDREGMSFWVSALLGALVSVVASVVPFSPVLGGGVAGYLYAGSRDDGLRVGAVSGAIAAVPVLLVVGLVFGGLGLITIVENALGAAVFFVGTFLLVTLLVVALSAGLSALGGYLGVYVREEYDGGDSRRREDDDADVEAAV